MVRVSRKIGVSFLVFLALLLCASSKTKPNQPPPAAPGDFRLSVTPPFRWVVLGDTRFHDPADTTPANAQVRQAMAAAIDKEHPELISITGDIVYDGADVSDWKVSPNLAEYESLNNEISNEILAEKRFSYSYSYR